MLDDPPGMRNYWSAEYLTALPGRGRGRLLRPRGRHARAHRHPARAVPAWAARSPAGPADYPVPWRDAPWAVHPFGIWEDPADDERGMQWVRDVRADVQPWSTGAVYLNFIGRRGRRSGSSPASAPTNYQRLAAVKAEYDPDNVFRLQPQHQAASPNGA